MDTSTLKKFAQQARRTLIQQVETKLTVVLSEGSQARRESADAVSTLESLIAETSRTQVIEQVAYTWFNRFCALRFMDANRYSKVAVVSPAEGFSQPEILMEAKQGVIDDDYGSVRNKVFGLLDGSKPSPDPQQEAYRLLLVAACNSYHSVMPFMFEKIEDLTELLIPDDLLSDSSILAATREAMPVEACKDVEVIGWLYQFYISEKKDQVFDALKKGKKITPENIPAATQLFTPHWIVRYLVENSLGRLWMLNFPNSKLVERMDYYIRPEQPETDFLRISSPEEIKICDPACGSGHMLTYAFDLLYAIYEEQGYQATEIPRLILAHNLYGVEIDQRAGALAAFALTMKAREKDRRFFTRGRSASSDSTITRSSALATQPNICVLENIHIDRDDLSAYMDKVGRNLFSSGLQGVVNQWEEANNCGSLIRPLVTDVAVVLELLRERQLGSDLFLAGIHQKVLKALLQADYLSPRYHVVVANPPYVNRRNMNVPLKQYLQKEYSDVKTDLFSAFGVRCIELSMYRSYVALMSPNVWMFIHSYASLRELLLTENSLITLVELPLGGFTGATVQICAYVLQRTHPTPQHSGVFIGLLDFEGGDEVMSAKVKEASETPYVPFRHEVATREFSRLPGNPLAYRASDHVRSVFERSVPLKDIAEPRQGMATTENDRFLRLWHEVAQSKIRTGCRDRSEAKQSGSRWFPYNKGGSYRKWFGNCDYVVNYFNDGEELKAVVKEKYRDKDYAQGFTDEKWDKLIEVWVLKNQEFYFRQCITWTATSSSYFGVRHSDDGFIFDVKGSACYPSTDNHYLVLAFLCTKQVTLFLSFLNPTIEFQPRDIGLLPVLLSELTAGMEEVTSLAKRAIHLSRIDWDESETSWNFTRHMLTECCPQKRALKDAFETCLSAWNQRVNEVAVTETRINRLFIDAYELQDELVADVMTKDVTLTCNPAYRYGSEMSESERHVLFRGDTMREFISYAVGCMLGRYSLDKPGLILASQGETADDFRQQILEPTFAPDEDNVLPLLDGDWFEDDITARFKEFLKVNFGTEHYDENLAFLENSLYPDNLTGRKRKSIRDYFLKDFYIHHIKLYKKRPIYWLFSSPKGTFNALIYMHRYRPDTVSVVLGYLRDFNAKLKAKVESLQRTADSANASATEKTKALKEIVTLKKDIRELDDYERDILYPLATERLEIDLDDGVKVSYPKFGKALRRIAGMDAGNDD